ncbi:MAG: response regulator, partial [Anaerolineae bacterium]
MTTPDNSTAPTPNLNSLMADESALSPRVLIVDDDGDIRRLIRVILERDGCIVSEIENGADALEEFRTNTPDLVLLDYLLPGMNGGDVCRLLREMPDSENVPIIMLTALDDPKTIEACFAAGATDFITKPIHRVVFRHRVRKLIQLKKTQDRLLSQTQVLRQMHGELMQSRKLYRTLVEKLPNGAVFLFDQYMHVSICGGELLPTLSNRSRTVSAAEDQTALEDYFPVHTRGGIRSFSEAALHGQSARFTYEFNHEGRSYIAHAYPVRDESGVVFAGVVIVQDITDMKHAEQLLRDNQQQLEQLVEQRTEELRQANQSLQWEVKGRQQVQIELQYRMQVERLISSISTRLLSEGTIELENSIQTALQAVGEFADADRCYVFQLSGDGLLLFNRFEWTSGAVEPQIHLWQSIPAALFRWLINSFSQNRVMVIDHPERLPFDAAAEAKFMDKRTVGSSIIVAMTFEDKLTGFLGIDSIYPDFNWPDNLPTLLKIVAELFATALEHKRTEEALRSSEKKLRQITDTMLDAVYQTDAHGVIEYASPSCWQVFGYRPEDFVQTLIYSYVHPDDVDMVRKAIQTTGSAEYRFRCADGGYIWV